MTCGDAVADLIAQHYGDDCLWLDQVRDGVIGFVDRCVQTLNTAPPVRATALADGAPYKERARTAEEIKATIAADERSVSKAPPRTRRTAQQLEQDVADPRIEPEGELMPAPMNRRPRPPEPKPGAAGFQWGV